MASKKSTTSKRLGGVYHHGDLKVALKRAALRLVLKRGPRGFALKEASELVGVTVAAPYRHFRDKDSLLAELAADGFRILADELQVAADTATEPQERLVRAGLAYLRFAEEHRGYFVVMFSAGLTKAMYPTLRDASYQAFDALLRLSRAIMNNDENLALQHAIACWALVHGMSTLQSEGAFSPSAEKPISVQLETILTGFQINLR